MKKDDFIGKPSLIKEFNQGSEWSFVGIEIDWEEFEKYYREVKFIVDKLIKLKS